MSKQIVYQLVALLILTSTTWAATDFDKSFQQDFTPRSGYIIMPLDGQYLIDLDRSTGISPGMIVSIPTKGKTIVHPVTHEVLGVTGDVKAVLKVTQVKSKYSYAKVMRKNLEIKRGDRFSTTENLNTLFLDNTGSGQQVYQQATQMAPQLSWGEYLQVDKLDRSLVSADTDLIFFLTGNELKILDANLAPIRSYTLNPKKYALKTAPAYQVNIAPTAAEPNKEIIINKKDTTNTIQLGANNLVGIAAGDLDGNSDIEIAIAYSDHLEIGKISDNQWSTAQSIKPEHATKILNIDSFDLNQDNAAEIFVTALNIENQLSSFIVSHTANGYKVTQSGIPMYFREAPLTSENTLLGQQKNSTYEAFSGPVFTINNENGKPVEGRNLSGPLNSFIYGFGLLSVNNSPAYMYINEYSKPVLKDANFETIYTGDKGLALSRDYVTIKNIDTLRDPLASDTNHFLNGRITILPNNEIIFPVNKNSSFLSQMKSFKSSYLIALKWDGNTLAERWRSKEQRAYLADFAYTDIDKDGQFEILQLLSPPGGKIGMIKVITPPQ